ncbi:MAG: helix-turn-helix domain-containing protein [Intestinimonas sp.]|nr:helix-turn-helix domain-containing protein [Intestinimonas sp.]
MNEFGSTLYSLRRAHHLTQRNLAERVYVHISYISKFERGAVPPASDSMILRFAEAMDVAPDELLQAAAQTRKKLPRRSGAAAYIQQRS